MNDTMTLLQSHRSIRKFTDEPVAQDTVEAIVACGQAAATSSNLQASTVIQVSNPDTRQAMAELAGGQNWVASAPVFLVWCADLARSGRACALAGGEFEAGMTEHFIIATVDVALAAQNAAVAAESLGLGICYIGGLRNDPAKVSALLALPDQVYPVFGFCLGHPAQDPEVKPRLPVAAVLMQERYDASARDAHIADYDEALANYYRTRTGGRKDSRWSEEMKKLVGKESRPHMRSFLDSRGFAMR
ncbi:MAG: oxygen-insensitive NADPH nitroreductase [Gammaproteobacteria bacterium]|nr:MAG: oxygen-insensitive NADPH nitroreductase [Gammaproteobacteria bacterium]